MPTNKRLNELPLFTGDTSGSFLVMNDSTETTTYKVQREYFLGTSQTSGTSGSSGTSGIDGIMGSSGSSGTSGTNGTSGSSGTNGTSGTSGSSGSNGSSGTSGSSGSSGIGTNGTSGTSGSSGGSGSSGTSGSNGSSGTSGSSGSSGIGTNGTSGTSGSSGSSGTSGTSSVVTLYLLEAYANVTYTLPGGFTDDVCRYSIVSVNQNVPSNWFNTSSYTFTPQKAGYWQITAEYDVYRGSGVEASIAIKKNGGVLAAVGSFGAVSQLVTKIVYLNGSTDYINIINVGNVSNSRSQFDGRSWFQARWVGE